MKKLTVLTVFICPAMAAALLMTACQDTSGPITTKVYSFEDSTAHARMTLVAELPDGQDKISRAIRESLMDVIDGQLGYITSYEGERQFDAFDGDRGDTEAFLRYYFEKSLDILARDSDKDALDRELYMKEDGLEESAMADILSRMPGWEYEFNLSKTEDTDRYAVFQSQDYIYMGGAHGGVTGAGFITYDKQDGSRFVDFLDPDCLEDIQPLIKGCLAAYFTSEDYHVTEENLRDFLLIDSDIIPLPAWPPYPSLNSLVFAYQQYEIAPYAAGMPAFAISFGELAPYLTPEAKKLLGVE